MTFFSYRLKILLLILFIPLLAGWAGYDQNTYTLSEAGYTTGKPSTPPGPTAPERRHTWGPDPGGIIYDRYYPPVIPYPPYKHPRVQPYYYRQCHPPFHYYPPYYEPEKPWYEDDLPIPAGRMMLLVDPVDAKALVNGYPLKRHPDLSYEAGLLKGKYDLEVRADGYETYVREVEIRGGERIHLTIKLKKEQDE